MRDCLSNCNGIITCTGAMDVQYNYKGWRPYLLILPAMPSTCRHRTGSINTEIQNKPSFEFAISQHQK